MNKFDKICEAFENLGFQIDKIERYSTILSDIDDLLSPLIPKNLKEDIIWAVKVFLWDLQDAAKESMDTINKEVKK